MQQQQERDRQHRDQFADDAEGAHRDSPEFARRAPQMARQSLDVVLELLGDVVAVVVVAKGRVVP